MTTSETSCGARETRWTLAALFICLAGCGAGEPSPELVARGEVLFAECAGCHSVSPDGPQIVGPTLHGVYGRRAGTLDGYEYSEAMRASGIVWRRGALDVYLEAPSEVVAGTTMNYAGVRSVADREAIIAYLQSLDERRGEPGGV